MEVRGGEGVGCLPSLPALPAPSAAVAGTESMPPWFSPASSFGLLCKREMWMLSSEARGLTNVIPGLSQAVRGGGPGAGPATELCVTLGKSLNFSELQVHYL